MQSCKDRIARKWVCVSSLSERISRAVPFNPSRNEYVRTRMEEPGFLLFHLRNYIYIYFSFFFFFFFFFFLVNRGRRRSEMKARSTTEDNRRRSRIPLFEGSFSFFFFSPQNFFPFIDFIITHIYLWGGGGGAQVNFRQVLASFVRSLNEHSAACSNRTQFWRRIGSFSAILIQILSKGERKRRFCNFHIR